LTEKEVDRLIETARKRGRNGQRDAAAILLAYRHGLRAQELCQLRWAQWPAPGSEDTELGVLMELEVGHGETEVYPRVQA
jgi:Phage integrase family